MRSFIAGALTVGLLLTLTSCNTVSKTITVPYNSTATCSVTVTR